MTLRVVGAGLGRTGTTSLYRALQQLLGGPCYHMIEVFPRPDHVEAWHRATRGTMPDWDELFAGFCAAVDWPASGFWRELSAAFPDAVVLLSVRESPETWWASASRTILHVAERAEPPAPGEDAWLAMYRDFLRLRFTPSQGWEPICAALGLPVPSESFPHTNTTAEFRARAGWDAAGPGGS